MTIQSKIKTQETMPRTKAQNEAIRAEKKQLIMDVALRLFAENGFESTSIDSIASHAGISKGLVYAYFECKDDLLCQILAKGMRPFTDHISSDMTMEGFVTSVEHALDHILQNLDFFKLYTIISSQPKVTENIRLMLEVTNEYNDFYKGIAKLFTTLFGEERALQEMLFFSVLMKGFTVITVFGDEQNRVPLGSLKGVVMGAIRERYIV